MNASGRERRAWSVQEDQLLRQAVELEDPANSNPSKWHAISKHVPNRTNKDCRKRWFAKMASDVVKGGWSPEEDDRLVKAIEKYGTRWSLVASLVQTRNSDQCAKRWTDTLNPAIDRTSWTPQSDALLIKAVEEHGKFWTKIVRTYFPGRTGLSAKNRYNSITRFSTDSRVGRRHTSSTALRVRSPSESLSSSSASASPVTPSASVSNIFRPSLRTTPDFSLESQSWSSYNSSGGSEPFTYEELCSALSPLQSEQQDIPPNQNLHTPQPHISSCPSSSYTNIVGEDRADPWLLGPVSQGSIDFNTRQSADLDRRNDRYSSAIRNSAGFPDVYVSRYHDIRCPNHPIQNSHLLSPLPLSLTDSLNPMDDRTLAVAPQEGLTQCFGSLTKNDIHGSLWGPEIAVGPNGINQEFELWLPS